MQALSSHMPAVPQLPRESSGFAPCHQGWLALVCSLSSRFPLCSFGGNTWPCVPGPGERPPLGWSTWKLEADVGIGSFASPLLPRLSSLPLLLSPTNYHPFHIFLIPPQPSFSCLLFPENIMLRLYQTCVVGIS